MKSELLKLKQGKMSKPDDLSDFDKSHIVMTR